MIEEVDGWVDEANPSGESESTRHESYAIELCCGRAAVVNFGSVG